MNFFLCLVLFLALVALASACSSNADCEGICNSVCSGAYRAWCKESACWCAVPENGITKPLMVGSSLKH